MVETGSTTYRWHTGTFGLLDEHLAERRNSRLTHAQQLPTGHGGAVHDPFPQEGLRQIQGDEEPALRWEAMDREDPVPALFR